MKGRLVWSGVKFQGDGWRDVGAMLGWARRWMALDNSGRDWLHPSMIAPVHVQSKAASRNFPVVPELTSLVSSLSLLAHPGKEEAGATSFASRKVAPALLFSGVR